MVAFKLCFISTFVLLYSDSKRNYFIKLLVRSKRNSVFLCVYSHCVIFFSDLSRD